MKYSQHYFNNWHYRRKNQSESWTYTIVTGLTALAVIAIMLALALSLQ